MYWNKNVFIDNADQATININMRCIEICGFQALTIASLKININMRCIEICVGSDEQPYLKND